MDEPIIGLTIRNSTARQIGNYRSEVQGDLAQRIRDRGCEVRVYDEQGTSGRDLSKRKVALQMLEDLKNGVIHGIGALDVKRLTRDEFGMDGAFIARKIVEAGGRFHTWDREYNLRLEDDLIQFQFQCFISGIDVRNIRNTFWSGIFKKLEKEPFYMKTPLGYHNVVGDDDKKHVAKDPAQAHVMDRLAELFDQCESLARMCRILNTGGPARPAFRGRGGDSTRWHVYGLRYILKNTIYVGGYSFGEGLKQRSTVWDKFAIDPVTKQPKTFAQHRPDLAYWDAARVRRWQRKFAKPANARVMKGAASEHLLAGVLDCATCGARMIGHGPGTYACPAVGSGKGRRGLSCTAPQLIRENVALRILRRELPRAVEGAQDIAERARAQLSTREPSVAARRLAFLQERVRWVGEQIVEKPELAEPMQPALLKAQAEILTLVDQVAEEEDARLEDESLTRTCEILLNNPIAAFDVLPLDKQARVYRLVFSGVRIETRGFAAARQWRLQQYVARIGDELRDTHDAPWGHKPNPKAKLPDGMTHDAIIFDEPDDRTLARHISVHGYDRYLGSLSELAGALVTTSF